MNEPAHCYRDRDNGVYFQKQQHRHDCTDSECRGCAPCAEPEHCTAAKNCSWHVAAGELTCGRCLASARRDLRKIGDLAPTMLTEAMVKGTASEAANMAGPSPHPGTVTARRVHLRTRLARLGPWAAAAGVDETGYQVMPDDDEHHPYAVTTRWEAMIREDYDHHSDEPTSVTAAIDYLDRNLHRIAQDGEQDFPLLARELRKCRQHLESVLHNDDRPERGVPCPDCTSDIHGVGPRLVRKYPHWCAAEDCERIHHEDDSDDIWQCPRVAEHQWTHKAYTDRLAERRKSA